MHFFAGEVLSDGKFAGLILYLLACSTAIIVITMFSIKIAYSLFKHKPYSKQHLKYIAAGIGLLIMANLVIEL